MITALLLASVTLVSATPRAGFGSYRDARLLCSEHVSGTGMHITWSSYATKDSVATVVAHYEKTSGRKATKDADGSFRLEWDDDHKLDIYPAASNDKFPHCDKKPAKGEQTVILLSSAARSR